jgi:hypothetical protein
MSSVVTKALRNKPNLQGLKETLKVLGNLVSKLSQINTRRHFHTSFKLSVEV